MPIYEYRCPNGHVYELFQRFADAQPEGCETCGAGPLQKVLYPVAVHYKGSGFYATDYGRGSRKGGKDSGDSAGSTSSDGASGDKSADTSSEKKKPAEASGQ
jgi:putative FmdB family regulatory protein